MTAISPALLTAVTAVLREAGRNDLIERLVASAKADTLTSKQAATLLGVASANTVKNWLEGGWFQVPSRPLGVTGASLLKTWRPSDCALKTYAIETAVGI